MWFNIGVPGVPQQAQACFILSVDDTMDSILNWYREEGIIFKGGSGSGINLSKIRSSQELLQGGGTASGPVSFMRGADASAGTIKSGGKTRRAAKMVILNADHPDVEEFIWCKVKEERKARVLRDNGFDMDLDGADSFSIQYQNANNSVRVTDEFMQAVAEDADWGLVAVKTGEVMRTVKARDLWRQIAQAAWECADPGLQFDTTINRWHTAATTGRINGSNPCSEYMHLDNSACNLASINLLKYLDGDGNFDVDAFRHTVEVVFTAQEILVGRADYPTPQIGETTRNFRQLGLGYANLGALLMALGLPYDSAEGRAWAAAITSLMTGHAYATSARTASRMGPFAGFAENEEHMLRVLRMHRDASHEIDAPTLCPPSCSRPRRRRGTTAVRDGEEYGVRNSQASVLAPTGCLVGGSLVATDRGLVRLRSLGDPDGPQWQDTTFDVLTDDGPRTATKFYVNGLEQVVDVRTERGYRITGNDEAPHQGRRRRRRVGVAPVRRPAPAIEFRSRSVSSSASRTRSACRRCRRRWRGPASITSTFRRAMSPQLAELVGYFMGDGSLHAGGLRLCVTERRPRRHRPPRAARQRSCSASRPTRRRSRATSASSCTPFGSPSGGRRAGFAKHRPHDDHVGKGWTPHVPDAILHTNDPAVYQAFLRGLFEADGTVTAGYPSWTTTKVVLRRRGADVAAGARFRHDPVDGHERARLGAGSSCGCSTGPPTRGGSRRSASSAARKAQAVDVSDVPQSARHDHIPVTRELIDRVAPANDRNRKVRADGATAAAARSRRRLAAELHERTGDAELGPPARLLLRHGRRRRAGRRGAHLRPVGARRTSRTSPTASSATTRSA